MEILSVPISVNWHLSSKCNYNCKYCFGHFQESNNFLGLEMSKRLLEHLSLQGTQKISFSGGEPLLCPYLGKILVEAKNLGMTTMVITNGSLLTKKWLKIHSSKLDWLGLSIDSASEDVHLNLRRGTGNHVELISNLIPLIKQTGIKLKINTVVTKYNWNEDMNAIIEKFQPQRWKVFRFLPIFGENDRFIPELQISEDHFQQFITKHKKMNPISEDNSDMYGSYLMIDPKGRLFQNTNGILRYSNPIIEIGINSAIEDLKWNYQRFLKRGGCYDW